MDPQAVFRDHLDTFAHLKRLPLLRALETIADDAYRSACLTGDDAQYEPAVIRQNFQGIPEYTDEFYSVLALATGRQSLGRALIRLALAELPGHGFSDFDRHLIHFSTIISDVYGNWYPFWLRAVRNSQCAQKLVDDPPPLGDPLLNHYTIIHLNEDGNYEHEPYSTYFPEQTKEIATALSELIATLEELKMSSEQQAYLPFLRAWKDALLLTDIDALEEAWTQVDELWMDVKYYIQFVHDLEWGYGDPLHTKAIPDFSVRFIDETMEEENATIHRIQETMVKWFKARDTPLSRMGLKALESAFAAIYYVPFQTGMSLHFRFSGQSTPGRPDVAVKKGVKIFFDPVSTGYRQYQTRSLIAEIFHDADTLSQCLDPIRALVDQVAAHEVGHAIYGLENLNTCIPPDVVTLLEEPRAELTSLFTMKLRFDQGIITEEHVQRCLSAFALQDLRRFAMYTRSATRPYTISAVNTYKVYERVGFIKLEADGKLSLHKERALEVLTILSEQFFVILKAEDEEDGTALAAILEDFETPNDLIRHLVANIKPEED